MADKTFQRFFPALSAAQCLANAEVRAFPGHRCCIEAWSEGGGRRHTFGTLVIIVPKAPAAADIAALVENFKSAVSSRPGAFGKAGASMAAALRKKQLRVAERRVKDAGNKGATTGRPPVIPASKLPVTLPPQRSASKTTGKPGAVAGKKPATVAGKKPAAKVVAGKAPTKAVAGKKPTRTTAGKKSKPATARKSSPKRTAPGNRRADSQRAAYEELVLSDAQRRELQSLGLQSNASAAVSGLPPVPPGTTGWTYSTGVDMDVVSGLGPVYPGAGESVGARTAFDDNWARFREAASRPAAAVGGPAPDDSEFERRWEAFKRTLAQETPGNTGNVAPSSFDEAWERAAAAASRGGPVGGMDTIGGLPPANATIDSQLWFP